jgi:hypothetical protein
MLWIDIGIFCGYTRKMQIAESYLQPLCTVSFSVPKGFFRPSFLTSLGPSTSVYIRSLDLFHHHAILPR